MDIGVYYAGKFTTREDLTHKERLHFLELLAVLDMGPRTALVLMVAVGAQLGTNPGLIPLNAAALGVIWLIDLAWLGLVWWQFLSPQHPRIQLMAKVDYAIRYAVIGLFMLVGLYAIFTDTLISGAWLRLKLVFFGTVVSIGLILRATLPPWLAAISKLQNPTTAAQAQQTIEAVYRFSGRWAHGLWALVFIMAFLGTTKPF
jgi:hypothetical protein